MNNVLDDALVGLLLLASLAYVLTSLGPRGLRRSLLAGLSRLLAFAPAWFGLARIAGRLESASTGKASGACGGCDNCGGEESTTAQSTAQEGIAGNGVTEKGSIGKGSIPEIRVPVGQIGRRGA
jgi:hypothetical protein